MAAFFRLWLCKYSLFGSYNKIKSQFVLAIIDDLIQLNYEGERS